jgi:hypothetical protein
VRGGLFWLRGRVWFALVAPPQDERVLRTAATTRTPYQTLHKRPLKPRPILTMLPLVTSSSSPTLLLLLLLLLLPTSQDKKVAEFNEECAAELGKALGKNHPHERAMNMGMINVGNYLAIPIPQRACPVGWAALPGRDAQHKMLKGCSKVCCRGMSELNICDARRMLCCYDACVECARG